MPNVTPAIVRGTAVAAGVVLGAALSLGISPIFAVVPLPLVVGAAVEGRSRFAGRVLMLVGAVIVSIFAAYLGFAAVEAISSLKRYHDSNIWMMFALSCLSPLLAGVCDLMLIADAIRARR